jgi:hypothetical protein
MYQFNMPDDKKENAGMKKHQEKPHNRSGLKNRRQKKGIDQDMKPCRFFLRV